MAMKKAPNFSAFHAEKWAKKQDTQEESQGEWQNFKDVVKPILPIPTGYGQSVEVYHAYAQGKNPSVQVGAYSNGAAGLADFYVCCDVCNTSAELNVTHPITHIDDYCKFHVHKLKNETISGLAFLSSGKVPATYQAYADKESNSNVILAVIPVLVDPMGTLNVSIGCKVCKSAVYHTEYSIQQSYPGSSNCFIDAVKDFCGKHRHDAQKEQKEQTLEEKVHIASDGNVLTKHNKNSYPSIDEYALTCTICEQKSNWFEAHNLEQWALGWAKGHKHAAPTAPTMNVVDIAAFKEAKFPNVAPVYYYNEEGNQIFAPQPNKEGGWMEGTLQFHGVSQKEPTMTQDLLKSIAKLSNFHVNLQAKRLVTGTYDYMAVCDKCGSSQHFNYRNLVEQNGDEWVELGRFLDAHRHLDVVSVTMTVGRKFRVE